MSPAGRCRDGEPRGVRSSRLPVLASAQAEPGPIIGGDGEDFRQRQNYNQAEPDVKTWIDLRSP